MKHTQRTRTAKCFLPVVSYGDAVRIIVEVGSVMVRLWTFIIKEILKISKDMVAHGDLHKYPLIVSFFCKQKIMHINIVKDVNQKNRNYVFIFLDLRAEFCLNIEVRSNNYFKNKETGYANPRWKGWIYDELGYRVNGKD